MKVRDAIAEIYKTFEEGSGDWAYEAGRFEAGAPHGTVLNSGKYIVNWKQQANGEWQTHRDIFNWDIPPSA